MTNSIVPLGKDENIISNYELAYSLVFFFIKSQFSVTNKRFIGVVPNLFWIIPVGQQDISYPLNNIATVASSTHIDIKKLLFGVIVSLAGISLKSLAGLMIVAFGMFLVVASFQAIIVIRNSAGTRIVYGIAPWEQSQARKLVDDLNRAIVDRL